MDIIQYNAMHKFVGVLDNPRFQCDLCDAGYAGYPRGHLHNRVKGHKQQSSAIAKHYKNMHGTMPQGLLI